MAFIKRHWPHKAAKPLSRMGAFAVRMAAAIAILRAAMPCWAGTDLWLGNSSVYLSNGANWLPALPPSSGDSLVFTNPGAAGAVLIEDTVQSVQSITFNGTTSFTVNTNGNGYTNLLANSSVSVLSSVPQNWNAQFFIAGNTYFNLQNNLTLGSALTNRASGTITLAGPGTMTLAGTPGSSASANFQISDGRLVLNQSTGNFAAIGSFGMTSGTVTLAGTGGNQIDGSGAITMDGGVLNMNGRSEMVGNLGGAGGTITNSVAGSSATLTLSGQTLRAYGGLLQDGAGTLALSLRTHSPNNYLELENTANSFTGGVTIASGARLIVGSAGALGSGPVQCADRGSISFNGNFQLPNIIYLGTQSLTLDGAGSVEIDHPIQGTAGTLIYAGTGTLTLTANNAVVVPTTVTSGALRLAGGANQTSNSGIITTALGQLICDSSGNSGTALRANNVTLSQNGSMSVIGSGVDDTVDRLVGALSIAGDNYVVVNPATHTATLSASQLLRIGSGFVHFVNSSGAMGASGRVLFDAPPALSGISPNASDVNASIIPWALVNASGFASYGASGVTAAGATGNLNDAYSIPGINFNGDAGGIVINGPTTINSLFHTGATGTLTLNDTLSLSSGALVASHDLTVTGPGALLFGSVGVLYAGGQLTLDANLIGFPGTLAGNGSSNITLGASSFLSSSVALGNVSLTIQNVGTLQNASISAFANGAFLRFRNINSATIGTLSGSINLTLQNELGNPIALTISSGSSSGVISGPGSLIKSSPGTVTLSGSNTFSGGVSINAGTLIANCTSPFGTGTVTLAGGTLGLTVFSSADYSQRVISNPIFVSPGVSGLIGGTGFIEKTSLSGPLLGNGTLTFAGVNGTGFSDYGFVYLAGDLSGFSGTIRFDIASNSNNLWVGPMNNAASTPLTVDLSHARVILSGASVLKETLDPRFGGTDFFTGTIKIGDLSGTGGLLAAGYGSGLTNFEIGALNTNATFAGVIADVFGGKAAITKVGTGTLTLSATANTYSGGTTVSQGALVVGAKGALGNGTLTIGTAAVLDLRGSAALSSLTGTGTLLIGNASLSSNSVSGTFATQLNGGTLSIGNPSSTSFSGNIGGMGTVSKTGTGTLTLAGTNSYAGSTLITGGVVRLGNASAVGSSTITVGNGASLDMNGFFSCANSLILTGTGSSSLVPGTLILNTTASGVTLTNDITSPITASVFFSKQLTLTGALHGNGYLGFSGPVLLAGSAVDFTGALSFGGTLTLASAQSLGNTISLTCSSAFDLNGMTISSSIALQLAATFGGVLINSDTVHTAIWSGPLLHDQYSNDVHLGSYTIASNIELTGASTGNSRFDWYSAGTLILTGNNSFGALQIFNGGTVQVGAGGTTGTLGSGSVNGGTFVFDRADVIVVNNSIVGATSVSQIGGGTLILGGTSTYTDGTQLISGVLSLASPAALGTSGTLSFNGGILQFSAANTTDYSPRFSTATNQLYALDTNGRTVTLASPLNSTSGTLTKLGLGTLILTANNTYDATTIAAGTLQIGNNSTTGIPGAGSILNNANLSFNRTNALSLPNAITGTGTLTQSGPGTTTLSNYQGTGPLTLSAGTLAFSPTPAPRNTPAVLLQASALSVSPNTTLDLSNHDLLIHNANPAQIESLLASAYFFGLWNHPGITSSAAAAHPTPTQASNSGPDENHESPTPGLLDGTPVLATDTLIKFTYAGDLNLDGLVNDDDFGLFSGAYFFTHTGNYAAGDLNFDGLVNDDDFGLFSGNYFFPPSTPLSTLSTLSPSQIENPLAPTPEPTSLLLLTLATPTLLRRHKRRHPAPLHRE